MEKKNKLIGELTVIRNNYRLSHLAIYFFATNNDTKQLGAAHSKFGKYSINFSEIVEKLQSNKEAHLKNYLLMNMRVLICDAYEAIKRYCNITNQQDKFKKWKLYNFIRIIRNAATHDGRFRFKQKDVRYLPITWNGRTIRSKMEGHPIALQFLNFEKNYELFEEMFKFAQNLSGFNS